MELTNGEMIYVFVGLFVGVIMGAIAEYRYARRRRVRYFKNNAMPFLKDLKGLADGVESIKKGKRHG